jgi:hypothetical protein
LIRQFVNHSKKRKDIFLKGKISKSMNRIQSRKTKADTYKHIGLIIPTTTRGLKVTNTYDLPFYNTLLSTFTKFCSKKHYYHFFLGYDWNDPYFEKKENRDDLISKFKLSQPSLFSLRMIEFGEEVEKGDLSTMWSILADHASKTCEYLYQLGDDIEFKSPGWETLFINILENENNIGAVGPKDENNGHGILTQSFVHITHLSIFGRYYPKELKNWFIDDWISEVYEKRVDNRVLVKNKKGLVRYEIKKLENEKNKLVERDRRIIKKLKGYQRKNITKIYCDKNIVFGDPYKLFICYTRKLEECQVHVEGSITSKKLYQFLAYKHKSNIQMKIDDSLFVRTKNNVVLREIDGTLVVQNIDNVERETDNQDIFLIQQFFIPKTLERYHEIKETLRRNVRTNYFKKIYLLNERIYTDVELGGKYKNVLQINISKRLQYRDILFFASKLNGYVVFSNSDIFFDETILKIRKSSLSHLKSVQCLLRYEYENEENLKDCKKYQEGENVCSQDSWIIHSRWLDNLNLKDASFNLGHIGCDSKIAYFFYSSKFLLFNEMEKYRTYHYHQNKNRNFSGMSHLPKPWVFLIPGYNSSVNQYVCRKIFREGNLFWQYPVITEKTFFEQNKDHPFYIGLPWATIIDGKVDIDLDNFIDEFEKTRGSYTCCQHISFRRLIPFWKKIGIIKLYTPHKKIGEDNIEGIKIIGCPLFPVALKGEIREWKHNNKYLYSFKGAYMESHYLSPIRKHLFLMDHPENTYIENIGAWHFNRIVYSNKQNKEGDYNQDKNHQKNKDSYLDILLSSEFTLCPSGSGPNSIRFWEALGVGSIPVLLSDTLDLPAHPLWEKAILRIKEKDYKEIPEKLSSYTKEEKEEMIKNCKIIYSDFMKNYRSHK